MTFKFYNYASAALNVNKAPLLDNPLTISDGHISGNQDIEAPTLIISTTGAHAAAGYNYVYIQDWSRYYFIVKRVWLADGALMITLREDYIYTARALILAQTGYCRYSGLGNGNLPDNRAVFQPATQKEEFAIEFENQLHTPMQDWYVIKFMSAWPFTTGTVPAYVMDNAWAVNAAYLNQAAFEEFVDKYSNISTEADRVLIGRCIQSINRINYIRLDKTAMSDYADNGIRFLAPFGTGSSTSATISWTTDASKECYIISGPEKVQNIFQRNAYAANARTDPDVMGTIHKFNTDSRFYKLQAQYLLKLPELAPIPFNPAAFGLATDFSIRFSITYEPFSENYIIRFRDATGNDALYEPVVQRCRIQVPFLTDTNLDLRAQQQLQNTLAMIGSCAGSLGGAIGSASSGNVFGAISGVTGFGMAINNYMMTEQRQKLQESLNMSMTPSSGGSDYWVAGGLYAPLNAKMYVLTQVPVMLPWTYKGTPDYTWRSLLTLDGTGYAEIDLVDVAGNNYNYTDSEIQQIKTALSSGVIFNASI